MNDYIADRVLDEFTRLEVSSICDSYSGLMTCDINIVSVVPIIKVYDDHASGIYDAKKLLKYLKTLQVGDVSLESQDPNNIWEHLNAFEL
jgi:hypothetical protein